MVTAAAWWGVHRQASEFASQRFNAAAEDVAEHITKRMADYEQVLRGGVALFKSSNAVSRDEWRDYIGRLDVEDYYPGILGIGFAAHVPANELLQHEAAVRRAGFPAYAVTPAGKRPEYYPIVFIEPFSDRNLRAFGYDMFSEPTRRAAMTRARDTGKATISGKLTLVQETSQGVQAGTLLYLPVYTTGADTATQEGRRRAIDGFVYCPFRMDDLMTGILGSQLKDVGVRVYDGETSPETMLFDSAFTGESNYRWRRALDILGRTWVVEVEARPALEAQLDSPYPTVVLGAGAVISLLLVWLTRLMMRERMRSVALARSNADLAEARSTAERARAEAESANAAKSKFLAAASHDIRQPVQSMMLLFEVLGQKLGGHPASKLLVALDHSLDALRMLLHGLLDVSKLDAGVVEAKVETVELAPLLNRLASEYALRAENKGLQLRVVPSRLLVRSDRALLERILRNMLENALRYTVGGSVLLGCRRNREMVRIEVHDTGIGIPADQVAEIFNEFHQVGNRERDRSQGLGLGLAIVRRLAQMLDHEITVRSRLGRGSCFAVTLPVTQGQPPADQASAQSSHWSGDGAVALVIDDEALVREGFRRTLETWGFSVLTAGSAEEAEQVVAGRRQGLDVIIADYRLRDGAIGTEAVQRVCAAAGRTVPAIIVTGDTAPDRIAEANRSGHQILHKPVATAELHQALGRLRQVA